MTENSPIHQLMKDDSNNNFITTASDNENSTIIQSEIYNQKNYKNSVESIGHTTTVNNQSNQSTSISKSELVVPQMVKGWVYKRLKSMTGFGYSWSKRYLYIDISLKMLTIAKSER